MLEQLPQDEQPELGDRNNLVAVEHDGKRYVIAGGPWRQQRDQARRASRLSKAEVELKRLAAVHRKKVNAQKLASQAKINVHHTGLFAYYLEKLKATPDGDGCLLDNVMIWLCGADCPIWKLKFTADCDVLSRGTLLTTRVTGNICGVFPEPGAVMVTFSV